MSEHFVILINIVTNLCFDDLKFLHTHIGTLNSIKVWQSHQRVEKCSINAELIFDLENTDVYLRWKFSNQHLNLFRTDLFNDREHLLRYTNPCKKAFPDYSLSELNVSILFDASLLHYPVLIETTSFSNERAIKINIVLNLL